MIPTIPSQCFYMFSDPLIMNINGDIYKTRLFKTNYVLCIHFRFMSKLVWKLTFPAPLIWSDHSFEWDQLIFEINRKAIRINFGGLKKLLMEIRVVLTPTVSLKNWKLNLQLHQQGVFFRNVKLSVRECRKIIHAEMSFVFV